MRDLYNRRKRLADWIKRVNEDVDESEVTKLYREYWKLKQSHKFYLAYTELGDEGIRDVIRLCRLLKKERKGQEQVARLLDLTDENNPYGLAFLERRHKWLKREMGRLDMRIERATNYLQGLNSQISGAKYTLDYCHDADQCMREEL
jgi:hypothetical protein